MTQMKRSGITATFASYVSKNIAGMLGISCYIIVDTYFISVVSGADGITVLNLCLPVYNLIYAIGAMLAAGSTIRYALGKSTNDVYHERYFTHACLWSVMIGAVFVLAALLCPGGILRMMGADAQIEAMGIPYLRTFMLVTPLFMLNYVVSGFVRNDGAPGLSMAGTIAGSMFNLVFDWVFMFPMGMGLFGAALATAFSPLASMTVCSIHFFSRENHIRLVRCMPSVKRLYHCCKLGVSAFVGEFSSGVITTIFNFLLLGLAGNVAVAAYGITANLALVAMAIYNGVAQGMQPVLCEHYGCCDDEACKKIIGLGVGTSLTIAVVMVAAVWLLTDPLVAAFNTEGSAALAAYAAEGLRMYFIGFLFAGVNTVLAGCFSAMDRALPAMIVSVSRGIAVIAVCAYVLAALFGVTGVWLAFPAAEAMTLVLALVLMRRRAA